MKSLILLLLIIPVLVYAQGTPHEVYGSIRNEDYTTPITNCLVLRAYVIGRSDTVTEQTAEDCGFLDTIWGVQCSHFGTCRTGDTLVVFAYDTCTGLWDSLWFVLDMTEPHEEDGDLVLREYVGIEAPSITRNYEFSCYPNPFNECISFGGLRYVEIYDMRGRLIESCVGYRWCPYSLETGKYFIKAYRVRGSEGDRGCTLEKVIYLK